MGKYAESTRVPIERSRAEIEKTLKRYGADGFFYGEADGRIILGFRMSRRHVKFIVAQPEHPQEQRQIWRAMLLVIKAKLESVVSNIESFDDAFMAQIVLPDGQTVGQALRPQIKSAYDTGKMPPLLPFYGDSG